MTVAVAEQPRVTTRVAGADEYLRRYRAKYEALLELLPAMQKRGPEMALRYVQVVAGYAASQHPGLFADARVENVALAIGRELRKGDALPVKIEKSSRRTVLHVATRALSIGGHTRTIANWVKLDRESRHVLALTDQKDAPTVVAADEVIVLPRSASLAQRALWLREVSRAADLVVLHCHPQDAVVVAAFAVAGGPAVMLLNHADHVFWMGSSIADAVINLRDISTIVSRRRIVRREVMLPIPLEAKAGVSSEQAREQLGIPQDQVMLLSVGRGDKYVPTDTHNFFRAAAAILDAAPAAQLYVLGLSDHFENDVHERMHLIGSVDDPSPYQAAADVYLESVPFGSQTAMLEAALVGLAVVRTYAPPVALLATDDPILRGIEIPADEAEYVETALRLVREAPARREMGDELGARARDLHTGEGWLGRLNGLYSCVSGMGHEPRALPECDDRVTSLDIGLSRWNRGNSMPTRALTDELVDLVLQFAYEQRHDGAGALASAMLWNFARRHGWNRRIAKEWIKAVAA